MSRPVALKRLALLIAVLLLAVPALAMASGEDVLQDCADDQTLSRPYSQAEYKKALATIPADLDEYTDCRSIIRQARLAGAGNGGASNPSSTSQPKKPEISTRKRDRINSQLNSGKLATAQPLKVGEAVIKPGSLESSSTIPAPLIVVLVLTALGAVGASAVAIRRIVIGRRNR